MRRRAFRGGITSADGRLYQTGGWCDPWIHIPPGRTLRLVHGLGSSPLLPSTFVAFSEKPFGPDCDERNVTAPAAGNLVVVEFADDEVLEVRNDTCEPESYLRLTVEASEIGVDGGGRVRDP